MKPSAYLVNCARAQIVVHDDLVEALRVGVIGGAGIDVWAEDPADPDDPLLAMENVVATPHSAAHSATAMRNMATHAARGIVEVLAGRRPTWPVNEVGG
jgi:D-3-phosphoglycerate dehydrogenase